MSNVYSPPSADMTHVGMQDETYEPKVFSLTGRIGRLRMLAFGVVLGAAFMAAALVVAVLTAALGPFAMILFGVLYLPVLVFSLGFSVRRLHDLNQSGWWVLLTFIPLLNLGIGLYLIFAPGTEGGNNFGPAPSPNPTWVKVCSFGIPVLMMGIGILAAIAIPAYQDYQQRANDAAARSERAL